MGTFTVEDLIMGLQIAEEVETPMESKLIQLEEEILAEKEKVKKHRSSAKKCLQEIQETIKNGNGNGKKKEPKTEVAVEPALS
jgi:hypothetical protein